MSSDDMLPILSHSSIRLCNWFIFLHVSSEPWSLYPCKHSLLYPEIICLTSTRWHIMLTSLIGLRERTWVKCKTLKFKYKSRQPNPQQFGIIFIFQDEVYNFGRQTILICFFCGHDLKLFLSTRERNKSFFIKKKRRRKIKRIK